MDQIWWWQPNWEVTPTVTILPSPSTRGDVEEAWSPTAAVLVVSTEDPAKRTTISAITRMSWFWKGFFSFSVPDLWQLEKQEALTVMEEENNSKVPKFFNTFEFISSMSSRFDLLGMFESKRKTTAMFMLKCSRRRLWQRLQRRRGGWGSAWRRSRTSRFGCRVRRRGGRGGWQSRRRYLRWHRMSLLRRKQWKGRAPVTTGTQNKRTRYFYRNLRWVAVKNEMLSGVCGCSWF